MQRIVLDLNKLKWKLRTYLPYFSYICILHMQWLNRSQKRINFALSDKYSMSHFGPLFVSHEVNWFRSVNASHSNSCKFLLTIKCNPVIIINANTGTKLKIIFDINDMTIFGKTFTRNFGNMFYTKEWWRLTNWMLICH